MMEETKRCPYCGEEILAVAKKCKYCGEWLEETQPEKKKQVPCDVCGEMIDEDAVVCPYCHEKVKGNIPEVNVRQSVADTHSTVNTSSATKMRVIYKTILMWVAFIVLGVIAYAINDDDMTDLPISTGFIATIVYTCIFIYRLKNKPVYLGDEISDDDIPFIVWKSGITWVLYIIILFIFLADDYGDIDMVEEFIIILSIFGPAIAVYFSLGLYHNEIRDIEFKDDDSWFKQTAPKISGYIIVGLLLLIVVGSMIADGTFNENSITKLIGIIIIGTVLNLFSRNNKKED